MTYRNIVPARFIARPNRFIAHVEVSGKPAVAHVKNTGRCRELLVPGARVYLEHSANPARKTAYSLIAVEKGNKLINMDSQAPNKVIEEALEAGWIPPGIPKPIGSLRREVRCGDARLDFGFTANGIPALMEVKGVTLEEDGKTFFPDAPTERGIKHLHHLIEARAQGCLAVAMFVIQMAGVKSFTPNEVTHPAFGDALRAAEKAGVIVSAFDCHVEPDVIYLDKEVSVIL